MRTIDPASVRPESHRRGRRLVVAGCLVVVAVVVGLGVKFWLDRRVPLPDAEAGRLARYMAGPEFGRLSDVQKAVYVDAFRRAVGRGELTAEQERAVIDRVNNPGGRDPVGEYFSLPTKGRERFLDDVIDRVLREDKVNPRPEKGGVNEVDRGRLADTVPPQDRARMDQFLQDLHDRRVARGVPDDGRFLFNRAR